MVTVTATANAGLEFVNWSEDSIEISTSLDYECQQPFKIESLRWLMNPRVTDVVATDDYKLHITFANGEVGVYDCTHLLDFGVFSEFRDVSYFKRARAQDGTAVWPHEQDICPDTLYEGSEKLVLR